MTINRALELIPSTKPNCFFRYVELIYLGTSKIQKNEELFRFRAN